MLLSKWCNKPIDVRIKEQGSMKITKTHQIYSPAKGAPILLTILTSLQTTWIVTPGDISHSLKRVDWKTIALAAHLSFYKTTLYKTAPKSVAPKLASSNNNASLQSKTKETRLSTRRRNWSNLRTTTLHQLKWLWATWNDPLRLSCHSSSWHRSWASTSLISICRLCRKTIIDRFNKASRHLQDKDLAKTWVQ